MWAPILGQVGSLRRKTRYPSFTMLVRTVPIGGRGVDNVLGEDRSIAAFVAPVQLSCWIGQPNSSGNPPELSNAGWDPYGLGDTSHNWWNVESGALLSTCQAAH